MKKRAWILTLGLVNVKRAGEPDVAALDHTHSSELRNLPFTQPFNTYEPPNREEKHDKKLHIHLFASIFNRELNTLTCQFSCCHLSDGEASFAFFQLNFIENWNQDSRPNFTLEHVFKLGCWHMNLHSDTCLMFCIHVLGFIPIFGLKLLIKDLKLAC